MEPNEAMKEALRTLVALLSNGDPNVKLQAADLILRFVKS